MKQKDKVQRWVDRRMFYLTYIWPVLHPIQYYRFKRISTQPNEMLQKIKTMLHEKELLQKYKHLTNEQLDKIYQLFDDNDNNDTDS